MVAETNSPSRASPENLSREGGAPDEQGKDGIEEICECARKDSEHCVPSAEEAQELLEALEAEEAALDPQERQAMTRLGLTGCREAILAMRQQIRQRFERHRAFLDDTHQLLGERNFYFDKLNCIQRKILEDFGDSHVGQKVLAIISARPAGF
ncbi:conserved hypothetical protein [Neospora caninum Liverpool]|uniref:Uncharacterized protein n=1 Tax=Neospora caninum (strain Liverpool) TaxID=572307 RepID=F0VJ40_NEOCL|nr:conserved hypothetical protein [Neospora caninum Liverpool]CBZ53751.1 conserved hypothetical protein [Neospora caninum Liverpool]CEL67743.1 TPA: hypothetical protein BN1204_035330 [Neospora caninum Liverpool]|eukprot:XP_003883783.1 conserved hypothetical protein [Neospora caninum Liverpool]